MQKNSKSNKMNLCPSCKLIHDKIHFIINGDNKNYISNKYKEFLTFCKDCKIDICLSCIEEHKFHEKVSYEDLEINMIELREQMDKLNIIIYKFKMNLEEIIIKLKKLQKNLDTYYNINNDIIKRYEINKKSKYYILTNLLNSKLDISGEIDKLSDDYSYGYNLNKLLYLYS